MASFKYIYELIGLGKISDNLGKSLITVFKGLDSDLDDVLKSGNLDDLKKFQEDAVKAADESGNIQAKQYLDNPIFFDTLKIKSQMLRSFDEVVDALKSGKKIDFDAYAKKYPDVDISANKDFFNEINDKIARRAKILAEENNGNAEDFLNQARNEKLGDLPVPDEHSPLGVYKNPQTPIEDLPKFDPKLDWLKIMPRLSFDPRKWVTFKASRFRSTGITTPIIDYADKIMSKTGVRDALQKLEKDVLDTIENGGKPEDIINKFAADNHESLVAFRNHMRELKDHVEKTYKTNAEMNGKVDKETGEIILGDNHARMRFDLIEEQRDATLAWIKDMENLVTEVSKGVEGKNGKQLLKGLDRIDSGELSLKDIRRSITGISRGTHIANDSQIRETGLWLDGSQANDQYRKMLSRELDEGIYNRHQHTSKPIIFSKNGGENVEKPWQDFVEEMTARDADGKLTTDFIHSVEAKSAYLGGLQTIIDAGFGQEAVFMVRQQAHLLQPHLRDAAANFPFPEVKGFDDALETMIKRGEIDPRKKVYYDKIRDIIDEARSNPEGAANTSYATLTVKERIFDLNRFTKFKAESNAYFWEYATRNKFTNWRSLPAKIFMDTYMLAKGKQIGGYLLGSKETLHETKRLFGKEVESYGKLKVVMRGENETLIDQASRAIPRTFSLGLIDEFTNPFKGASIKSPTSFITKPIANFNNMASIKNPVTWLTAPLGLKPSKVGSWFIGGNMVAGAGIGIYNSDKNDDEWDILGNVAWGGAKGGYSTFVDIEDSNNNGFPDGIKLGKIPRLGIRAGIEVFDAVVTDGFIGGNAEGVYHASKGGSFFDTNRKKDDGYDLGGKMVERFPSLGFSSILLDDDKQQNSNTAPAPAPAVAKPSAPSKSSGAGTGSSSSSSNSSGNTGNSSSATKQAPKKQAPKKPLEPWEIELSKHKTDAAKTLAAINKDAQDSSSNLAKTQKYIRIMGDQATKINDIKKDILSDHNAVNKETRIQRLNDMLITINDNRQSASEQITPLQEAKDNAENIEVKAKAINSEISNLKTEGDIGLAKTKLGELQAQAQLSKVASDETNSITDQILLLAQDNQTLMNKDDDYKKAYANDGDRQFKEGVLAVSGGKNGLLYQFAGQSENGAGSYVGGLFNTVSGGVKKFSGWWDELERNSKSKEETNWLLGIKAGGMFLGGMLLMNTANDWFMGGKMGKGLKLSILGVLGLYLLNKTGEWGDKIENIRNSKSLFTSQSNHLNGARTEPHGKNTSHIPTKDNAFDKTKIKSSNPNPRDLKAVTIDLKNGTVLGHSGKGLPRTSGDIQLTDGVQKALRAVSQGQCANVVLEGKKEDRFTIDNIKSENGKVLHAGPITLNVTCDVANDPSNLGVAAGQ